MKRISVFLLLCCMLATPIYAGEPNITEPNIAAQGAALVDGISGRLLWGKNAEKPMEMASTTKIMTAVLVLEKNDLYDVVTISKNAARQPDVQMNLKEGEQWYVRDLLRAMMLQSYNDAAVALAEHTGGSVETFCMEMTAKAKQLGAKNTVFGSPNGLDSHLTQEQHHSTPYDMALITGYALQNPQFREIVQLPAYTFCDVSGKRTHTAVNTDRFLQMYAGALGVKTGYTNKAGHCFVGAAERDDVCLVSVVLGCGWGSTGKEAKWTDTKKLMDYGFAAYDIQTIATAGSVIGTASVSRSPRNYVEGVLSEDCKGVFSTEEAQRLTLVPEFTRGLQAPVQKGEKIGTAALCLDGTTLYTIDLVAADTIPTYTLQEQYQRLLAVWVKWMAFL